MCLIFHKYKWETYHQHPVFYTGFFQDYSREKKYQVGHCVKCDAYKYREIIIDESVEMEIQTINYKLNIAKELQKNGRIEDAISVLKIK